MAGRALVKGLLGVYKDFDDMYNPFELPIIGHNTVSYGSGWINGEMFGIDKKRVNVCLENPEFFLPLEFILNEQELEL